ncbi:hypothetical protein N657DRAFT_419939 [Parathielavia appendiculata]|uniref:Uncharacterized protein n=1 Tax=Parathielavia appendiculata TaxID=2587402 RepID=A0AAN6U1Q5_9PEZI|nr:hypothetical protein N657DRAFT_419939 [Parathielavia appendiculata]
MASVVNSCAYRRPSRHNELCLARRTAKNFSVSQMFALGVWGENTMAPDSATNIFNITSATADTSSSRLSGSPSNTTSNGEAHATTGSSLPAADRFTKRRHIGWRYNGGSNRRYLRCDTPRRPGLVHRAPRDHQATRDDPAGGHTGPPTALRACLTDTVSPARQATLTRGLPWLRRRRITAGTSFGSTGSMGYLFFIRTK